MQAHHFDFLHHDGVDVTYSVGQFLLLKDDGGRWEFILWDFLELPEDEPTRVHCTQDDVRLRDWDTVAMINIGKRMGSLGI